MHTFTPVPVWNVGRPESKVIRASKRCDVVMTAGHYVVNALALKKPVVFYALGADMTQLPFDTRLGGQWLSYLHRRRIRTVNCILSPQDEVFWAARLLGVQDKIDQRQIEFPQRRLEIPTQGLKKKSCSRPLRRPFPRSSFL